MILLYRSNLKVAARSLRNNMTKTEKLVWDAIRRKKLEGIQFYRQKTIGSFIVDFYALAVNLVIEIDGMQHLRKEHAEQDNYRDTYLSALGLRVLRFSNFHVQNALPEVIKHILEIIRNLKVH